MVAVRVPGQQYLVDVLAREAGLDKHLTPHGLRHSAITVGLDACVSLRDMQDFARHADPKTTRRHDRSRHALNRHATYAIAGAAGRIRVSARLEGLTRQRVPREPALVAA
jgi:integrase